MNVKDRVMGLFDKLFFNQFRNFVSKSIMHKITVIILLYLLYFFIVGYFIFPTVGCFMLIIAALFIPRYVDLARIISFIGLFTLLVGLGFTMIIVFAFISYILYIIIKDRQIKKLSRYANRRPEELAGVEKPTVTIHISSGGEE